MFSLIVSIITIILMIASILIYPKIKITNKLSIDTYWVITIIGAMILIIGTDYSFKDLVETLLSNDSMNPLKIIILFLSMTFLSVYLDKVGFFSYLAYVVTKKAQSSQKKIFISLFLLISLLTIFTSNDIIILTFTPFICYFCKSTKINPFPYLILEFTAANTLSMSLLIGNPTNIYIAGIMNIGFIEYFKNMFLIGVICSLVLFIILYLIFKKDLSKPLEEYDEIHTVPYPFLMIMGIVILLITIILMAISNYISLPMYLISLGACVVEIISYIVYKLIKKSYTLTIKYTIQSLPFAFLPFLLSMVVIIGSLTKSGITDSIAKVIINSNYPITYGFSSFICGNLVNNIPMSILYSDILKINIEFINSKMIYSTIISSNLCALMTPLGSLAGMMFIGLVKKQNLKFGFVDFLKYSFISIMLLGVSQILILL